MDWDRVLEKPKLVPLPQHAPDMLCRPRPIPSSKKMMVLFLPRELEATHSAPVSNNSGVTRTLRMLRTLCESWSCSFAYKEGAAQGAGRMSSHSNKARAGISESTGR